MHAPASLKRFAGPLDAQAGLRIRGMHAPASLKLEYRRLENFGQRGIRGMHAPASLKRRVDGRKIGGLVRHPGHACPGLIEARRPETPCARPGWGIRGMHAPASLKQERRRPARTAADGASGACMPRPH